MHWLWKGTASDRNTKACVLRDTISLLFAFLFRPVRISPIRSHCLDGRVSAPLGGFFVLQILYGRFLAPRGVAMLIC